MANTIKDELVTLSTFTWSRLRERLEGLGDEEYRWAPVPDSWTVRTLRDGRAIADGNLWPKPATPFTSLAWRITHLIDVYGSHRNGHWLHVDAGTPVNSGVWRAAPDAAGAVALLEEAAAYWNGLLTAITETDLWEPIGARGGQYAPSTRTEFALHQLDEAIHHGAEVGVLRDLYRLRDQDAPVRPDEVTVASLAREPNAVARAADVGRWDLVVELVESGADVNAPERSALHQAAANGDLAIVRLLVEHGARLDGIDPDFKVTPLGWAQFFGRLDIAEYLAGR